MNTDNRLYRWVKVKSKDDLPTEEGQYHTKQPPYRVYFNPSKEYKQYQDFWIAQQYEYLSPIAEASQEEMFRNIQIELRDYINDKYDHRIPDEVFKELSSKYILIKR